MYLFIHSFLSFTFFNTVYTLEYCYGFRGEKQKQKTDIDRNKRGTMKQLLANIKKKFMLYTKNGRYPIFFSFKIDIRDSYLNKPYQYLYN